MAQKIYVVKAWNGLADATIQAWLPPMQKQCDEFARDWASFSGVVPVELHYLPSTHNLPKDGWPIFINRHSSDPGALGWHTADDGSEYPIYGRVFAGDCEEYGVSVSVDLSHEVLETIGDPDAQEAWTMPNGTKAAREACDAVESDDYAITIDGVKLSDYVLPAYFSAGNGPYDKQGALKSPCDALTPGGYMSICGSDGNWTQITADRHNGRLGRRAQMTNYRSLIRHFGGVKMKLPKVVTQTAPLIA